MMLHFMDLKVGDTFRFAGGFTVFVKLDRYYAKSTLTGRQILALDRDYIVRQK